jgi:hypothetical protein
MYKLKFSPDSTGYSVLDGNTNVFTQLDGGDPRVRADKLGAAGTVAVQWTLGPANYKLLRAFYRTGTKNGSEPFQVDLVGIDDDQVRTYTARFVPGTFKLASQSGLTYIQTASLWVVPLSASAGGITGGGTDIDQFNDNVILIGPMFTPPAGQKVAWAMATVGGGQGAIVGVPFYFVSGGASSTRSSGQIGLTNGAPFGANSLGLLWSDFAMPTEIPVGATIISILPVVYVAGLKLGAFMSVKFSGADNTPTLGLMVGTTLGTTLAGQTIGALIWNSVPGPAELGIGISFVAMAVCYV